MADRNTDTGPFPGGSRYNSFGYFLKEKFGCRVHKIVVDAGFTCPNRDGTVGFGGCTYCSNDAFRPGTARRTEPIPRQVEAGIAHLKRRYRAQKFIVYFQPYSNTYAPLGQLIPLYESAVGHPEVVGIAVGTRPDCVDAQKIAWFEGLARKLFVTLEYGLESIHDPTLERINRGHDFAGWLEAVRQTRGRGIHIGAHLILGFPWESREQVLATPGAISDAGLDFLKIHHLHVVRHTALAREFLDHPFPLPGYEEYLSLLTEFLELLNPAIRVERIAGLAPEGLLLGPQWGRTKAEIQRDVERALAARDTWQGKRYHSGAEPLRS
jgi:radical SAM protein (TIGR01212 family)